MQKQAKGYSMETAEQEPDTAAERKAFINSLGFAYTATFIPQSQSRNAGEKSPSLNWKVKLTRSAASELETDYMQGIGHVPKDWWLNKEPHLKNKLISENETPLMTEKGKYSVNDNHFSQKPLPAPKLEDVLYSLCMDADVLNYSSFEEWATNTGYEADSRKAEKIYNDCLKIALQLRGVVGGSANMEKLQELFQDY